MGKWLVIEDKILNLDSVTYIENLGKTDDSGPINLIAVHFVSGDKVLLHLADDGFLKLTESLFDRSQ
jgi:hypothetical protein